MSYYIHMNHMNETALRNAVIELASDNGWRVHYDTDSRRVRGEAGYPDLTLARGGVVLFVELKVDDTGTGYLKPDQRAWRDAIGVQWRLWRPRHLVSGEVAAQLA